MVNIASIEKIVEAVASIITVAAPLVIKGATDGKPFAEMIYGLVTGKNLTNDDIDKVLAKANALSAQIQSPDFIPPAQSDDV